MKIAEEPFTPAEFEKVNKVYQTHLGNFLVGVFGILIFAATSPMFPHKHRERPETPEEYLNQSLWALLILGSISLYYYYRSKWALRRDVKERLKEVYEFEVLKKERLFAEKTFYTEAEVVWESKPSSLRVYTRAKSFGEAQTTL